MTRPVGRRKRIAKASADTIARLQAHVANQDRLCVIKAPPGSGKTFTLLEALGAAVAAEARVAVAGQTNAQCDDICRRYVERHPGQPIWRFAAGGHRAPDDLDPQVVWITDTNQLPLRPAAVVATTAKWSTIGTFDPFAFLFVDEAWQMAWADLMLLSSVSDRFVLIGDPGQIAPVVSIPVERWETSPRAPHQAAPELILADPNISKLTLNLDACRRLPSDAVELVRPFYDFDFDAWAEPGERYVRPSKAGRHAVDPAMDLLESTSAAIVTLPTPPDGPPLELDEEVAAVAADIAVRVLERKCLAANDDSGDCIPLRPGDIGIAATHRVVNSAIIAALPAKLRHQETGVRVDTPERWQGLERKLMIVVHPLSGVIHPSGFDLETGRLCVMASRHQSGMIVVTRDHVPNTLRNHIPQADQAVGRPDIVGRGHHRHLAFWETVERRGAIVATS